MKQPASNYTPLLTCLGKQVLIHKGNTTLTNRILLRNGETPDKFKS